MNSDRVWKGAKMFLLGFFAVFIMGLCTSTGWASGSDRDGNAIAEAEALAEAAAMADANAVASALGGDQSIKNSSLALSQSLGDVDLGRAADCVVTEQYGIIIWQRQNWEYDPWCIAKILDGEGKHREAAQMRCFHKPTAKLYGNSCIETLTFSPLVKQVTLSLPRSESEDDDDDEREARYAALEKRMDQMDANRTANVRRYNREQAEVRQKEQDNAQQTLDALKEYHNEPEG